MLGISYESPGIVSEESFIPAASAGTLEAGKQSTCTMNPYNHISGIDEI